MVFRMSVVIVSLCLVQSIASAFQQGQDPCPKDFSAAAKPPNTHCTTTKLAQIPQGAGTSICLWELSDCTNNGSYVGIGYAPCASPCQCNGGICSGLNSPAYTPAPTAGISVDDETTGGTASTKKLYGNSQRISPNTLPDASQVIPANAGDIMRWTTASGWSVKYIKCVDLQVAGTSIAKVAIYKMFRRTSMNPGGLLDETTDRYIGTAVLTLTTTPPGGLEVIPVAADGAILFPKDNLGRHMEAAVPVTIPLNKATGETVNCRKWFHVHGLYYLP